MMRLLKEPLGRTGGEKNEASEPKVRPVLRGMHIRHAHAGETQYENTVADFMNVLPFQQEEASIMAGEPLLTEAATHVPSLALVAEVGAEP